MYIDEHTICKSMTVCMCEYIEIYILHNIIYMVEFSHFKMPSDLKVTSIFEVVEVVELKFNRSQGHIFQRKGESGCQKKIW